MARRLSAQQGPWFHAPTACAILKRPSQARLCSHFLREMRDTVLQRNLPTETFAHRLSFVLIDLGPADSEMTAAHGAETALS